MKTAELQHLIREALAPARRRWSALVERATHWLASLVTGEWSE